MTKTQANEPGFVLVPRELTEAMLDAAVENLADDIEGGMSDREFIGAAYGRLIAAAPIVPAPAYGVKETLEPFAKAATGVGAIYRDEDRVTHTPHVAMILTVGDLRRARSAYDALSSAPVEEADAKAGETVASDFLARLRAANRRRDAECRAKTNGEPLPILFRTTEFAGEVGELLNVIKKMERERLGWGGKRATREAMLEEFGGVLATLDLLAMSLDVDLTEATAAEFNAVTIRLGLTTCLTTPSAPTIPSEPEAKGEAGAGPVGEAVAPFGYLKPENNYTLEPRFIYAKDRNEEWMSLVFTEPVYARPVEEPGEVDRLRAEGFDLAANQCRYGYGDEHGHHRCAEIDRLTREVFFAKASLAETQECLERVTSERDNAIAAAKMLTGSHAKIRTALVETRERLEKVEAAARPFAEVSIASLSSVEDMPDNARGTISVQMGAIRALRAALSTQESSAALAGDGKEAGL